MAARQPVILVIMDGWGLGRKDDTNPIHVAKPETFATLSKDFPMTSLQASGISVGLPWGEIGNSEVGHLTIGAGKVLYQHFPRISMAIQDGSFFKNAVLKKAIAHAKNNGGAVNLAGLLTRTNAHASLDHLLALIKIVRDADCKVRLHLFADGKDSPPKSVYELIKKTPAEHWATLTGRYYAMDRSQNWELVGRAYRCLTEGAGEKVADVEKALDAFFATNDSEEFVPPWVLSEDPAIKDGDALIFFNFREDSIRQLVSSFVVPGFDKFPLKEYKDLHVVTMTAYDKNFDVPVAFPPEKVNEPLAKVISEAGQTQLRVAETYKYAHVTYFFNGLIEPPFKNEYRVLIPSLGTPHPEENPQLMAAAVTARVLQATQNREFDFVLANYSNPDTIGHTGNYEAALAAVKVMDEEIGKLMRAALASDSVLIITSDHGNLEEMLNPTSGSTETQHDPNPVPLYLVGNDFKGRNFPNQSDPRNEVLGILSDVAPTVLELMGIPQPDEMTGKSLLRNLI